MADIDTAVRAIKETTWSFSPQFATRFRYRKLIKQFKRLPRTSETRLRQSVSDGLAQNTHPYNDDNENEQTYFYLGYGSNMCALSFLVRRQIKPLSQVNVVVPEIALTFDLPGIPYTEPCFGNVRFRDADEDRSMAKEMGQSHTTDYHKDRWQKGLVGVVYEVTATDFAHIIATEGGGASYTDVLVDCYPLSSDPSEPVPSQPTKMSFKAHTLFAPSSAARPDPSYAQPSARYLQLIMDGGKEHNLPTEYREYLSQIRPYTVSTSVQRLGQWLFTAFWTPVLLFLFLGGGQMFLRPDGTFPEWYAKMATAVWNALWASYDNWFKPMFGDGERTITDGGSKPKKENSVGGDSSSYDEKTPLLNNKIQGRERDLFEIKNSDEMV